MNQAHISKGGRVESFMASLQGVLEVCRTNVPPLRPQTIKEYNYSRQQIHDLLTWEQARKTNNVVLGFSLYKMYGKWLKIAHFCTLDLKYPFQQL